MQSTGIFVSNNLVPYIYSNSHFFPLHAGKNSHKYSTIQLSISVLSSSLREIPLRRKRGFTSWRGLTRNPAISHFTYLPLMSKKTPGDNQHSLPGWGLGQDDLLFIRTRLIARKMQRGTTFKTGMH